MKISKRNNLAIRIMKWIKLESESQLSEIQQKSHSENVLIFKHSTRCSISRTALDRLERNWNQEEVKNVQPYYLDLIAYREVSNGVARHFDVEHQSPQVIVIKGGQSVYDRSHFDIDFQSIKEAITKN
jgi:bacillithiol system protein YtxJ